MFKQTISIVAVAGLVLALAPAAQAGLVGQLGLLDEAWFAANPTNPDTGLAWQAGDTYHLAFSTVTTVTQCTYPTRAPADAQWTDINNWDAVVQTEADAAGIGTGAGVTWHIIGSTSTVNARDHAVASGPVYTCVGNPIASNYGDMWDGAVANPITHIDGTPVGSPSYANLVLTGSNSDGTKSGNPLGDTDTFCYWGNPGYFDVPGNHPQWMRHANPNQDMWRPGSIYGLSEALTVVADNAEPVADADGPYDVPYGGTLDLDGSSSTDDSGIISYDWDIGSGALSVITASATDSSITWQDLVDAGLFGGGAIDLTVTDDGTPGLTGTDGTTFTVGAAPSAIIPEPSTFALAAFGLLGLIGFHRRRRR